MPAARVVTPNTPAPMPAPIFVTTEGSGGVLDSAAAGVVRTLPEEAAALAVLPVAWVSRTMPVPPPAEAGELAVMLAVEVLGVVVTDVVAPKEGEGVGFSPPPDCPGVVVGSLFSVVEEVGGKVAPELVVSPGGALELVMSRVTTVVLVMCTVTAASTTDVLVT